MPKKIINWEDGYITVTPPTKTKKITGTRLGSILGLNKWNTPFTTWCEITKTFEKPFESTIFTEAGKIIEPKQAQYMKDVYGMSDLVTPTDKFGEDYFKKTWGDFYHDNPTFGGMWDYLLEENGKPYAVLEMKTSKRAEDWLDDIPEYYALQSSLYAWLLGVDTVYMVASFLNESDYEDPNAFKCSFSNTKVIKFNVSERYPNFDEIIAEATEFWNNYVLTGISPAYDEKKDKEVLDALRGMTPSEDIATLCKRASEIKKQMDDLKVEYEWLTDAIKVSLSKGLTEHNDKSIFKLGNQTWTLSRSKKTSLDTAKLKADGIYDNYTKESVVETLKFKEEKEG